MISRNFANKNGRRLTELLDLTANGVDASSAERITMWKSGAVAQMDRATVS